MASSNRVLMYASMQDPVIPLVNRASDKGRFQGLFLLVDVKSQAESTRIFVSADKTLSIRFECHRSLHVVFHSGMVETPRLQAKFLLRQEASS